MIEENDEYYDLLLDDMDMEIPTEDMDSESGSQNGLQGVAVEDTAHGKKGTMVTMERPGIPGEAKSSGCACHK